MISLIVIFIFIVYGWLMLLLMIGWQFAFRNRATGQSHDQILVSVIIAARNEAGRISLLLKDITQQSYKNIEVIVVDDHSEDTTANEVMLEMANDDRIKLIRNEGVGKKQAITHAVNASQGAVIVTTDADCRVSKGWIESIIPYFNRKEIKFVFGGVRISTRSFFDDVQSLEFSSLIGSGAATSALSFPTLCNGANLAFRKEVFNEVGGYSGNMDIPSGDDEFLMRKVKAKYPKSIAFAGNREAVVSTAPSANLNEFIQQRIRWAGKWKYNSSRSSILLALFIFCFQVSTLSLPVLVFFHHIAPLTAAFLWVLKVILEFLFLQSVNSFLSNRWSWPAFILLQVFYPFYVVAIGLGSNFLSFEWKGRALKSLSFLDKG